MVRRGVLRVDLGDFNGIGYSLGLLFCAVFWSGVDRGVLRLVIFVVAKGDCDEYSVLQFIGVLESFFRLGAVTVRFGLGVRAATVRRRAFVYRASRVADVVD